MAKIAVSKMKSWLSPLLVSLLFTQGVNGQNLPAEIEYYKDDNVTNQIPYFDNRFRIDAELEEVTLLFYRQSGAQPVILVRPDGSKLKINDLPEGKVQWFDDRTFDMIKIKEPMVGPWQVIGQVTADSKIMVVSEVNLSVAPLPEIVIQGETLKVEGRLFNGDVTIDDPSFNDVLLLDVDFFSTNNSDYDNFGAEPIKLASFRDDGRALDEHARDSIFTGEFELDFAPGEWEPVYIIKMPMATRELKQQPIIVRKSPIAISVETSLDETESHQVTFTIDPSYVDPDSILIQGKVIFPDRQVEPFSVMEGKGTKRIHNIQYTEPGVHRVSINIFGETTNDREFRASVAEFSFNVERVGGPLVPNLEGEGKGDDTSGVVEDVEMTEAMKAELLAQAAIEQEAEIAAKQQENILYIVAGNVIVIIVAAVMFFLMRRKKPKK